jgi:hypothetical protein
MSNFHSTTFRLLGIEPSTTAVATSKVELTERRLGFRLPASVREWYCDDCAIDILSKHSNQDWPITLSDFEVTQGPTNQLLPFKRENQGVCIWAVALDGSDDPPVFVDVDSNGNQWNLQATTFSTHVYTCVWDYARVFDQAALVQAQNGPFTAEALAELRNRFNESLPTFGWPGCTQHRFEGKDTAILIWAAENQADWFVGAGDATLLRTSLQTVWNLDSLGQSLYDCTDMGKAALDNIRHSS